MKRLEAGQKTHFVCGFEQLRVEGVYAVWTGEKLVRARDRDVARSQITFLEMFANRSFARA